MDPTHELRRRQRFLKGAHQPHGARIARLQRTVGAKTEQYAQSGIVADLRMHIEWQVVRQQADVIAQHMMAKFPYIVSVRQNINPDRTNVIMGRQSTTIRGKDEIQDQLKELKFEISDMSFYQINHEQTEKLYQQALDYAELNDSQNVIDSYCGVGTIGLFMASHAERVYGVEIVQKAVMDAKKNAALNGLTNTHFEAGKAEDIIINWQQQGVKPHVVMIDPPRKGCDSVFIDTLKELKPDRIVYVSCNPSTLMRDIQSLSDLYHIEEITPVDMFPQTTHVEAVCKMTIKG